MFKKLMLLATIIMVTSSCSLYRIDSEDISSDFYPAKTSTNDVVYSENLTRPHEVIGYVTVNAERAQDMNEIIDKIKREAAILGADAITDIKTDATGTWKKLPAQQVIGNAYVRANYTATVVIFK